MGNGFPENRFRLMAKHLFDESDVTRRIPIRRRTETLDKEVDKCTDRLRGATIRLVHRVNGATIAPEPYLPFR
jgi:hypothetical protein